MTTHRIENLSRRSVMAAAGVAIAAPWIGGARAQAAKLQVATTFTIIQDIAQNVAGDLANVVSITRPGAEIHDYQPTLRTSSGRNRRNWCCGTG